MTWKISPRHVLSICLSSMNSVIMMWTFAWTASLQLIAEALDKTNGFSIALDWNTFPEMSYLDVCLRFFLNDEVYSFHALALPPFHRHTGQIISEVLVKFLDALYLEWRKNFFVRLLSDGDRSMTEKIQGVMARLSVQMPLELYRTRCALRWFDLLMQRAFSESLSENFLFNLDRCSYTSSSPTELGGADELNMSRSWW